MPTSARPRIRAALGGLSIAILLVSGVTGCGGHAGHNMSGDAHMGSAGAHASAGHAGGVIGDGLSASAAGLRLAVSTPRVPSGKSTEIRFQIIGDNGKPVTTFQLDQTKLMHFYLIRNDLTGFQHVHPTMAADGTWTASLATSEPGAYRAYTSFIAAGTGGTPTAVVLGERVDVEGTAAAVPLPAEASTVNVDGYTIALSRSGASGQHGQHGAPATDGVLTVTVFKDSNPVTDLQPYLDTYAHLSAFHEGDLAIAHLHPEGAVNGDRGGPTLTFQGKLPRPGNWRLFIQFQTAGALHSAAITISAR
jgi:hypothetical protein